MKLHFFDSYDEWYNYTIGYDKKHCVIVDTSAKSLCIDKINFILQQNRDTNRVIFFSMDMVYQQLIKTFANALDIFLSDKASVSEILRKINEILHHGKNNTTHLTPLIYLTGAEQQILTIMRGGFSSQSISKLLSKSPQAISTHKTNIKRKLEIDNNIDFYKWLLSTPCSFTLAVTE